MEGQSGEEAQRQTSDRDDMRQGEDRGQSEEADTQSQHCGMKLNIYGRDSGTLHEEER